MKRNEVMKKLHNVSELLSTIKPTTPENENINLRGLPHSARNILVKLYEMVELNQRTLSKHVGCSPQAVSKSIKKLEHKGLIVKNSGSQKNENNIMLTQIGKETAEELGKIIDGFSEVAFDGFSDQDLSTFNDLLERIYNNINYEKEGKI
jgi:MarR family transcriptional regulator for hemolysin